MGEWLEEAVFGPGLLTEMSAWATTHPTQPMTYTKVSLLNQPLDKHSQDPTQSTRLLPSLCVCCRLVRGCVRCLPWCWTCGGSRVAALCPSPLPGTTTRSPPTTSPRSPTSSSCAARATSRLCSPSPGRCCHGCSASAPTLHMHTGTTRDRGCYG